MPAGRTDLIPEGYEVKDKRVLNPVNFPDFPESFSLRASQQEVYDAASDSCIINAKVAWGKTFMGLCLAKKLGQKTLVVVHNKGLREQWAKEVKKLFNIEAGIIGSGQFNIDAPIVIGNIQTLYNVLPQVSKEFGTLIVDEVHHTPANTFSKIIDTSHARYKIGLSGTLQRKDGRHIVIPDYFGFTRFEPARENYVKPKVHVIKTDISFPDGNMPWSLKNNELASSPAYQELVTVLAKHYMQAGHKVLVVSDRTRLLNACAESIGEDAILVLGDTDQAIRDELDNLIKTKGCIFATQQIFSEGVSVNQLGVLVLTTPVNNEPLLEQLIGRITRIHPGKKTPIVVDIWLKGRIVEHQARQRLGHYMRQGYEISYF
jgi:superfamily II DNA or RNA helicase